MKRTPSLSIVFLLVITVPLSLLFLVNIRRSRHPSVSRSVEGRPPPPSPPPPSFLSLPSLPSSAYLQETYSKDPDTVMHGFYYLGERKDGIAVPRAKELLRSDEDYIWLNAALYLGARKQPEAIPYLIKALRHTAWRSDPETVRHLIDMTGMAYGIDFERWQHWWISSHPDSKFDWTSHLGPGPRLPKPAMNHAEN